MRWVGIGSVIAVSVSCFGQVVSSLWLARFPTSTRWRKVAANPPVDFPKRLAQAWDICHDIETPTEAGSMRPGLESEATDEIGTLASKHEAIGVYALRSDKGTRLPKILEVEQLHITTTAVAVAPGGEWCAVEEKLLRIAMGLNSMRMMQKH